MLPLQVASHSSPILSREPDCSAALTIYGNAAYNSTGIFPNEEAVYRLVGAILLEQNDEWAVQRARYMTLETITALSDDVVVSLPTMAD